MEFTIETVFVFILGAIIGSFLNVCIYRLPKKRSIVSPPSHCPACNKNILWHDNIPIISYLLLGGRCRFCKAKISFRYIIVEALTGALLAFLFLTFRDDLAKFFAYSMLACGLIVATFVDFEIQEIPDEVSIGGLIAGLALSAVFPNIFNMVSRWGSFLNSFLGVLAGAASIYIIRLFGKIAFKEKLKTLGLEEAMGFGDVMLMAMIGAFLGWKLVLFTFFIAPVFGAPIGIIAKLRYGQDTIPYGPYLALGALVAIFFGQKILNMFFGYL